MSDNKPFVPFVSPETNMAEFTVRALIIGLVMSVILGAANAYLGLKAGMTIAATYPAAVIGMALLKSMGGTILEENFARTVGSIGESIAAGAIFTIPAFYIAKVTGWERFDTLRNYLIASSIMFAGGILGIMFVALLRRVMVEDRDLPFPESVAASEIHKAGRSGGTGAKFLFGAMGIGALIQTLGQLKFFAATAEYFAKFSKSLIDLRGFGKVPAQSGVVISSPGVSPAYMGVGYIIGPKLAALNFSGGLLAWGLFVPIISYFIAPTVFAGMTPKDSDWIALSTNIWKFIVRPMAIGGMLVSAAFTLFKMRKSLATGISRSISDVKKAASGHSVISRTDQDIAFPKILMGIGFAGIATFAIYFYFSESLVAALVATLVMIVAGFFFAAVSGYLVGIIGSSNNPISGLTLSTLIIAALLMVMLGMEGNKGVAAVLGVAAVVCVSSAVAGEMLQDLKVGHILGGTPWRMQLGDILGVGLASAVMFLPLIILQQGDINATKLKNAEKEKNKVVAAVVVSNAKTVETADTIHSGKDVFILVDSAKPEKKYDTLRSGKNIFVLAGTDTSKAFVADEGGFGGPNLPAPQASLMAMLSQGIVKGEMAWPLIIVGMLMGLGFILMQVKSPMLISVGMYLPLETTFAIFIGGMIKGAVEKMNAKKGHNDAQKARVENTGVLLAAGLIAGEALIGLVFAALAFFEVKLFEFFKEPSFYVSLGVIAFIAWYLIQIPVKNAGKADEPAPPTAVM